MDVVLQKLSGQGVGAAVALGTLATVWLILKMASKSKALVLPKEFTEWRLGFKNMEREIAEEIPLEISGHFPEWLSGSLYRNGPGVFDIKRTNGEVYSIYHWFDGLTVLHRFKIKGGKVMYRNRKVVQAMEDHIAKYGSVNGSFGQDPCQTLFQSFFSHFTSSSITDEKGRPISNVGVTISKINGEMYAKTDSSALMKFDAESLEPEGWMNYTTFGPQLKGQMAAAHAHYDAETKEFLNFTLEFGKDSKYHIFSVSEGNPTGKILTTLQIDPVYIHSFAVTKNFFILNAWPVMINPLKMLLRKNVQGSFEWNPSRPTSFYVIDRKDGRLLATYQSPAFFCFHNINAFEKEGNINIFLSAYKTADLIGQLSRSELLSGHAELEPGQVRLYVLENIDKFVEAPSSSIMKAKVTVIMDGTLELPRINDSYSMKEFQYVYGIGQSAGYKDLWNSLVKLDISTGKNLEWTHPDCTPGEPIFVPSPSGKSEDDGLLLSVVLDAKKKNSFLLVLNAKDLVEVARATVPQVVPFGFHGKFCELE